MVVSLPSGDRNITEGNTSVETDASFYATDRFTTKACEYVSDAVARDDDKPFFLYVAYNAPHWPLNAKWDDFVKYRGKYTRGWEALMRSRLAKQKELGMWPDDILPAPHVGPTWESLNHQQRVDLDAIMAAYAGCIDSIDQNVGMLVQHLEKLNKLHNTLILFLSDNGACQEGGTLGKGSVEMVRNPPGDTEGVRQGLAWANASNTPFRLYKHFLHEGGANTPLIAHWPAGIPAGSQGQFTRQYAYLPDIMATCVELSAAQYPSDKPACVGVSFAALLKGQDQPVHSEPIFWEHEGNAAVRWGQWKLVREYEKPWELYDLAADRTEMHDLSTSNSAQRDEMIQLWEQWATQHQVAFPKRFNMYEWLDQLKKKGQQ